MKSVISVSDAREHCVLTECVPSAPGIWTQGSPPRTPGYNPAQGHSGDNLVATRILEAVAWHSERVHSAAAKEVGRQGPERISVPEDHVHAVNAGDVTRVFAMPYAL